LKEHISKYLTKEEVPEEIKGRLLNAARSYLLFKDLGDLFGQANTNAVINIAETINQHSKNKTDEH